MAFYGIDKRENRGKNPSSNICETNSGIKAMYGRKGVKKVTTLLIKTILRISFGGRIVGETLFDRSPTQPPTPLPTLPR